jgi:hypothetical protein
MTSWIADFLAGFSFFEGAIGGEKLKVGIGDVELNRSRSDCCRLQNQGLSPIINPPKLHGTSYQDVDSAKSLQELTYFLLT